MAELYSWLTVDFDDRQQVAAAPHLVTLALDELARRLSGLHSKLRALLADPAEFGD